MSTVQYIPSSLAASVANTKILCIYACGFRPTGVNEAGSGKPTGKATNHWVFHCAIGQTESIRIDPSPSGPNLSIVVIVSKKTYLYSDQAVKVLQLTTKDLTVGGFINLLVAKKYDKYQFSQSGQGCRYWVYSVVNLLKSEGKVTDDAQVQAVSNALRITWSSSNEPLPAHQQAPITEGKFFALGQ